MYIKQLPIEVLELYKRPLSKSKFPDYLAWKSTICAQAGESDIKKEFEERDALRYLLGQARAVTKKSDAHDLLLVVWV